MYLLFRLRTFVPYSMLGKTLVRIALRFKKWRRVVVFAERQPTSGAVIYVTNHIKAVDSLVVGLAVPRQASFLAKSEYYKHPAMALALWLIGAVSVDRSGGKAGKSLNRGKWILRHGGVLIIHGEGTRSPDGKLHNMRTGFVELARDTKAMVVPTALVYIGDRYVETKFGRPIPYSEYVKLKPFQFAELVTARIHELDPSRPRSGRLAQILSIGQNAMKALRTSAGIPSR